MEADQKITNAWLGVYGLVIVGLVAWVHYTTFAWLFERYLAADSYYSHGFLVPLVTAMMIWMKRGSLEGVAFASHYGGLALCVVSLAAHAAGLILGVHFASGFSLFFLLVGITLFILGRRFTSRIRMPLLFLLFMIPLPLVAINAVSFPLKTLVAEYTGVILGQVCGLPLRIDGFRILFPHAALTIENPCSGLRSIIVMVALGFVFSYLSDAALAKRIWLLLLSIPIAVISNIVRVLMVSVAVYVYGERMAQGLFHDLTGYIVFAGAFGAMYASWRAFQCKR